MSEEAKLNLIISAQNQATGALNQVTGSLGALGRVAVTALKALPAILTGAAAKDMVDSTVRIGTEVLRLSQDLGVSAEEASKLRLSADDLGVSTASLVRGMSMFSTRLKEVGTKSDPFAQLGVQVTDANGRLKDSLTLLGDIADRFQQMPDSLEKLSAVRELFGRGGEEMVRFLNQGREGIRKFGEDAEKMGLVFSAQKIQQVLAYKLAINNFRDALDGLKVAAGSELLPTLTQLTSGLIELGQNAIPWVRRAAEAVMPTFMGLWNVLQSVWMVLWRMISTAISTAQAMGIMSAGAKAAGQGFQWALTLGKELGQQLQRLEPLGQTIGKVLAGAAVTMKDEWAAAGHIMEGVIKAIMDIGKGDFKGALADLTSGFKAAGKDMGDLARQTAVLGPGLQAISVALGTIASVKLAESVLGWFAKVWKWAVMLGGVGAAAGPIGQLAAGFGLAARAILGGEGLAVALDALSMGLASAGTALVAAVGWPALIAAAVLAVGVGVYQIIKHWGQLEAFARKYWREITEASVIVFTAGLGAVLVALERFVVDVVQHWGDITAAIHHTLSAITGFFTATLPQWAALFSAWLTGVWNSMSSWFTTLPSLLGEKIGFIAGWLSVEIPKQWTAFTTWLGDTAKTISQWLQDLPNRIHKGLTEVANWLRETVPKEWNAFVRWLDQTWLSISQWISDLPSKLLGAVTNIAQDLMAVGSSIGAAIWSGITGALGWMADKLKEGVGALQNAVKDVAAGFQQGWQEGQAAAGGVTSHAAGGIFTGPTLLGGHRFGEAGPEALVPLTSGNLARYGAGGLGGGTINVTINVQGSLIHQRDLKRELTQLMKEGLFQELKLQKQMAY